MKRVYSSQNFAMVELNRIALEENGIRTLVRNQYASIASRAIPNQDACPELWIVNDADLARAQSIISQGNNSNAGSSGPWRCRACGEESEGGLISCWNCGKERPDEF